MTKIKVGTVDMYGFLSRDKHPQADDAGKTGTLVAFSREETPSEDEETGKTLYMDCFTIRFDDGREVEIMEHEVASIATSEY
jgi:hypothetical protein